ncbi:MAG TPA: hypothetical protein VEU06_02280 [Micropepsaceae bacterium]|nr:hypothetical protein [Micropepsaceae bacterium]
MNLIRSGRWGLVLDPESLDSKKVRADKLGSLAPKGGTEQTGHFILERYTVDGDGNICLTPKLRMREMHATLDIIQAELQGLLAETHRRFPGKLENPDWWHALIDWGVAPARRH